MRKVGFLFILFLIFWGKEVKAQNPTLNEVVPFTGFLIENGNLVEAIKFIDPILDSGNPPVQIRDSLLFFKATAHEKLRNDSMAMFFFQMVSEESPLFVRSRFMVVQKLIAASKFSEALEVVRTIPETNSEYSNEVKAFLWLGLKEYTNNQNQIKEIPNENVLISPRLKKEFSSVKSYSAERKKLKRKSPLIAGLLSALVPGLGKVYSGSVTQGIASFLRIGILGGIATELLLRQGYKDPQFIFFGGVAAAYYVGGIYGSVYLPKLNYNEKLESLNHNVKISLSIPF